MDGIALASKLLKVAKKFIAAEILPENFSSDDEKSKMIISDPAKVVKKAFEFNTKEELKQYFKEHPDADKTKHWVKKEKKEGKKEEPKKEKPKQKTEEKSTELLKPSKPHAKKKINTTSIEKIQDILKTHELDADSDELKELAGFKSTLGQRVPEQEIGKYYVRNAKKLKADFLKNMDPANYRSPRTFKQAQERINSMPVNDFAKILAAVLSDEEEEQKEHE